MKEVTILKYLGYTWAVVVFEFLGIPQFQFMVLSILMIFDFFLWIWKQFRVKKDNITSYNAWLWAIKKGSTVMLVFGLSLVIKANNLDPETYLTSALSILIMVEFYSMTRNIYAIRTGVILPELDVVSILVKKLWDIIQNLLENILKSKK